MRNLNKCLADMKQIEASEDMKQHRAPYRSSGSEVRQELSHQKRSWNKFKLEAGRNEANRELITCSLGFSVETKVYRGKTVLPTPHSPPLLPEEGNHDRNRT